MPILHKPLCEFSRGCCLARTLQADEHDHGRRLRREINADVLAAKNLDEFVADDFHDLLSRTQALEHFLAERFDLTVSVNCFTTLKLTSASRSAIRIYFIAS